MIKPVLTGQVQLGQLLNFAGTVLVIGLPALYIIATMRATIDQLVDQLKDQKAAQAQQFTDIKNDQQRQFNDLRTAMDQRFSAVDLRFNGVQVQIAAIPDYAARLTAVEHKEADRDRSDALRDARLDEINERSINTAAALAQIVPGNVKLGVRGR